MDRKTKVVRKDKEEEQLTLGRLNITREFAETWYKEQSSDLETIVPKAKYGRSSFFELLESENGPTLDIVGMIWNEETAKKGRQFKDLQFIGTKGEYLLKD